MWRIAAGQPHQAEINAILRKLACGNAHFKALAGGDHPATYHVARTVDDMMAGI